MSEETSKFIVWASKGSKAIDEFLDLTSPFLLEQPQIDPQLQWVLKQLAISCSQTSESALLLISYEHLWDAEILVRSVIEGTLKYAFLCVGSGTELLEKVQEYWEDLPEITRMKRHGRVQAFFDEVDNPDAEAWRSVRDLLMQPDELNALRSQYPRGRRQQLEQKWSFSEIIRSLSNAGVPGLEAMHTLAYGYGMASHLVHQDADAMGIIWDRRQREDERRIPLEIAHAARLISDLIVMAMLRATMTYKLHNQETKPAQDLYQAYQVIQDELSEAITQWGNVEYPSG